MHVDTDSCKKQNHNSFYQVCTALQGRHAGSGACCHKNTRAANNVPTKIILSHTPLHSGRLCLLQARSPAWGCWILCAPKAIQQNASTHCHGCSISQSSGEHGDQSGRYRRGQKMACLMRRRSSSHSPASRPITSFMFRCAWKSITTCISQGLLHF